MASRQGWNPELTDFHYGGIVYSKDRQTSLQIPMEKLHAGFRRQGSLQAWTEATNIYRLKPFAPSAFQLLIAFGSPLMTLIGATPTIFYGKSRLLPHHAVAGYFMQSVWGDYRQMIIPIDESVPRLIERLCVFGNLPPFVANPGESERPKANTARALHAFSYGQGIPIQKHHMEDTQTSDSWSSIMLIHGGNDWRPTAEGLEYQTPLPMGNREVDRVIEHSHAIQQVISTNYGVAGQVYASWLAQNRERLPEWIMRASEQIKSTVDCKDEYLHIVNALACVTVGALAAHKLGLIAFHPAYAIEFGHECLTSIAPAPKAPKKEPVKQYGCLTPGCKNKHSAKGYCKSCYQRIYMKDYMKEYQPAYKAKKKASAKSETPEPPSTSEA